MFRKPLSLIALLVLTLFAGLAGIGEAQVNPPQGTPVIPCQPGTSPQGSCNVFPFWPTAALTGAAAPASGNIKLAIATFSCTFVAAITCTAAAPISLGTQFASTTSANIWAVCGVTSTGGSATPINGVTHAYTVAGGVTLDQPVFSALSNSLTQTEACVYFGY